MNLQELRARIEEGEIDTVVVAVPDVFGRLVGKRFTAPFYLQSVAEHGTHGCNYLLTVNIEMDPLEGFKLASWDQGYGDFAMKPDLESLRALPWEKTAAVVICDMRKEDGSLVAEAPRSVLRGQLERVEKMGLGCN